MKRIIGTILGLVIGLPQGLGELKNFFKVDSLPHGTVYIIIAFGLAGGFLMGFSILRNKTQQFGKLSEYIERYVDLYFLMMISAFAIGVPILVKVGIDNIYASALFNAWFFVCIGAGLALSGLMKILWKRRT